MLSMPETFQMINTRVPVDLSIFCKQFTNASLEKNCAF